MKITARECLDRITAEKFVNAWEDNFVFISSGKNFGNNTAHKTNGDH